MEKVLEHMLVTQNELNNKTAGSDWQDDITKDKREINWLRCVRAESNELVDSYPWEHWSKINAKPDVDNAFIEIADLWHFIMSYYISNSRNLTFKQMAADIAKTFSDKRLTVDDDTVGLAESLIKYTFENKVELPYLVYRFCKIVESVGMSFETLTDLYHGKSVLNGFRQDNGYKEGTYSKVWSGKQDNVYMLQIVRDNPGISRTLLYAKLNDSYSEYAA